MENLYPPGPVAAPAELVKPTSAYKRHAWLAVLGLVAFVVVYGVLCFLFTRIAYRNITGAFAGGEDAFVGLLVGGIALVLAVFMLKALFTFVRREEPNELEITRESEPKLFAFIDRLADETGAPRPHRVFLSPRVNAAVFYDLTFFNLLIPTKKNLDIGLGLVNVLTLSEFKAVLAHEFGHFAQRSMAVGRWVYVAQQVAGHIVARRDWFDEGLSWLSTIDLRVAWLGWIVRFLVWSIRAVLDTAFSLVVLAQRALDREMEFQADLVAVSVTGSDALNHALHRLTAADGAWDDALGIAVHEHGQGRRVRDLFELQSQVKERMRVILDDPHHDAPPELPADGRGEHRIFEETLAQAPRMWSTHPSNREREDNTKRHYVDAPLDERPAWTLFHDPPAVRDRMTVELLSQLEEVENIRPSTPEEQAAAIEVRFGSRAFDRRYRGAYLGRSPVLDVKDVTALYDSDPEPDALKDELGALYPESLAHHLEQWRNLETEQASLEALRDGILTAPGGVIRHRGRALKRKDLPESIALVVQECAKARAELCAHDRRCRTAHLAAANALGGGWRKYLEGLGALLHYAEHAAADVDDAAGHLTNVFSVVIADGRVSSAERRRLVNSATEVYVAMWEVYEARLKVQLPKAVAERLEIVEWNEALPDELGLLEPSEDNIGDWMDVAQSWVDVFSGALHALAGETLETLLEAEARVAEHYLEGKKTDDAPPRAKVPRRYTTRAHGTERERQRRLDWWDRFATADGFFPGLARFVVAGSIVGGVLGFGANYGDPDIVIYNALDRPVNVKVGQVSTTVLPLSTARIEVPPADSIPVVTKARGGEVIESFDAEASNGLMTYVYNVARASPLVEWTASYGSAGEVAPRQLGTPRWTAAAADHVFEEPPDSVSTKGSGSRRTVFDGFAKDGPDSMLDVVEDETARAALIGVHARWDLGTSEHVMSWLALATDLPNFASILERRLAEDPHDVATLRHEQDRATPDERSSVCGRHRQLAESAPENGDLRYVAARCIDDDDARDDAFMQGYGAHPENGWLAFASSFALAERGRWAEALRATTRVRGNLLARRGDAALMSARYMRVSTALNLPTPTDTTELERESDHLRFLSQLETGTKLEASPLLAYSVLAKGQLVEAVETAKPQPNLHARVLRLAAASDGAPSELVQQALALPADQGVEASAVWAAIGLAAREGKDTTVFDAPAKNHGGDDAETMLRFARDEKLREDPDAVKRLFASLPIVLRTHAYAMALVVDPKRAPSEARAIARSLLFASERPHFMPTPPGGALPEHDDVSDAQER